MADSHWVRVIITQAHKILELSIIFYLLNWLTRKATLYDMADFDDLVQMYIPENFKAESSRVMLY